MGAYQFLYNWNELNSSISSDSQHFLASKTIINVVYCKHFRWATCLLDSGEDLDTPNELKHERFGGAPGFVWGAKKQCEVCTDLSVLGHNLPL